MKKKICSILILCVVLLSTGCGSNNYIKKDKKTIVTNETTGQNLQKNILCKPEEKDLYNLVELCSELLTEEPLFVIINTYTTGLSKEVFTNVLKSTIGKNHTGKIYSEEIAIPIKNSDLVLPCGVCSRYYNE